MKVRALEFSQNEDVDLSLKVHDVNTTNGSAEFTLSSMLKTFAIEDPIMKNIRAGQLLVCGFAMYNIFCLLNDLINQVSINSHATTNMSFERAKDCLREAIAPSPSNTKMTLTFASPVDEVKFGAAKVDIHWVSTVQSPVDGLPDDVGLLLFPEGSLQDSGLQVCASHYCHAGYLRHDGHSRELGRDCGQRTHIVFLALVVAR